MTAWDYAKSKGTTMKELSLVSGQGLDTLRNWFNNPKKRMLIDLIIDGIKYREGVN